MVCTLRGVCVTCQAALVNVSPQLCSSEPGWKLVDGYSLEKVVERVYEAGGEKEKKLCILVKTEDRVLYCVVKVSTVLSMLFRKGVLNRIVDFWDYALQNIIGPLLLSL